MSNGVSGSPADILAGGGEMGALMRALDWSATPLGPPDSWPRSLVTAVRIMLTSRQPIWIGWGKELTYLYNDPYRSIIGGKHPQALGRPTAEVWREIWGDIGPMLATAMQGHEGTYVEQQLLVMERNGYPEETYYTFSYSPVPDDDGSVGGIICANAEDTQRVIGERQLGLLGTLATRSAAARNAEDAYALAAEALAGNAHDLPFALIYAADDEAAPFRLVGAANPPAGTPETLARDADAPLPVAELLSSRAPVPVEALADRFGGALPTGAWSVPASRGLLLPVPLGESGRQAMMFAALNPYRLLDEDYASFLGLVAGQIGGAVANAEAYERERRRAEALAEIDAAKTQFFSNVSHEFRTPLTLMLGPLEEVLEKSPDEVRPADRALVEVAHRNGLRLMRMVNGLLDFSRIEAGRAQARFVPTDLAAFTRELTGSFADAAERAGLTLAVTAPPLARPAFVDPAMWETIVLNLLSNAFKFTFEGGIEVALAEADGRIRLTVRDTGTGIAAAELPRLFERFHRVAGARGRSFEGSGVGLALVQELAQLHGGSVRVDSEEGRGSRFHVEIPAGSAHLPAEMVDTMPAHAAVPSRADAFVEEALRWLPSADALDHQPGAATGHVLLADDNADMRDYVGRLLAQQGYEVTAVADGEAALAALHARPADLLLSDVMMPRLDGFGLLAAVRADPALRELPVILLSARAGEEAKLEGLDAGADDYLVKPFSGRELAARVSANIALARVRRETRAALAEEGRLLATLNRTGAAVAAELDLDPLVQMVTDAGVELTGAAFGAFFYNVVTEAEESYLLYTLSGVERSAFDKFPMPRNTAVFGPTFAGDGVVRSDDILADPRYGRSAPHHGMPAGHLPVRSYLAVPVTSRSGEVIGGLFFGHPETGRFNTRHEQLMVGLAGQAAVAMDNARLYQRAQREIAQRSAAEDRLRELNATLEARVAEEVAHRAEAEEALRQAQKMEAVGQLTGGIAHDFNNLLTVVTGNIDMAGRALTTAGFSDARARRALDNAMKGADRAASLTQRLLAFSRRQPLAPKATDVDRLVRGMSDLLHRALGERVRLEIVSSPGLWRVEVDPNQLESAILNLAVNARDAMPDGGRLTIETGNTALDEAYSAAHAEVAPGHYVMLAVTDSGSGMDKDTIARVFEPFFTTKEVGKGTGLGLSMVYGFVKQSGGHVKLYSEEGAGTTVRIYLPRLLSDALPEEETAAPDGVEGSGHAETILVVEDDDDVRAYTVECLRELGYRVLEAHDGASAMRLVERRDEPVDLLFTDVVMPGMNGSELAAKLREAEPRLRVLYTSGYTRNAIVHGGRLDHGVEMIAKPFSHAALARKVRDMLDAGRTGRVLLVHEAAAERLAVAEALAGAGLRVEQAATAAEALGKVRAAQGRYDGVAIALGAAGEALAAELRAAHAQLPIVLAGSGSAGEDRCLLVVPALDGTLAERLASLAGVCGAG